MSEWKQLWLQYHPVADRGFAAYAERVVLEGFEESGVIGSVREELTRGLSGMLGKEPVFAKEAEGACIRIVKGLSLDSGNDDINGEALSDNQKAESYRPAAEMRLCGASGDHDPGGNPDRGSRRKGRSLRRFCSASRHRNREIHGGSRRDGGSVQSAPHAESLGQYDQ